MEVQTFCLAASSAPPTPPHNLKSCAGNLAIALVTLVYRAPTCGDLRLFLQDTSLCGKPWRKGRSFLEIRFMSAPTCPSWSRQTPTPSVSSAGRSCTSRTPCTKGGWSGTAPASTP